MNVLDCEDDGLREAVTFLGMGMNVLICGFLAKVIL